MSFGKPADAVNSAIEAEQRLVFCRYHTDLAVGRMSAKAVGRLSAVAKRRRSLLRSVAVLRWI